MDALRLPLNPGSTTDPLHPINVFGAGWAVLRHALGSLNPDTGVVRRTHHRSRSHAAAAATESRGADTASVASSRGSRRSHTSSVVGAGAATPAEGESADANLTGGSGTHRHRHRTHASSTSTSQRHRHRTSSQDSDAADAPTSSSRRTRSAEEPLAAARRAAQEAAEASADGAAAGTTQTRPHRSHSDGVRNRSRRRAEEDGGSGVTTPRLATAHPLSPAATAAAASGLTPPLAPPPPVSRGLGKPPLSGRHRSPADGDAGQPSSALSTRHRHHRTGSGSGGVSSSGRSSRSRRRGADTDDVDSNEGSVIVIRDGAGTGIGSLTSGLPSFFSGIWAGPTSSQPATSLLSSPREWWRRVKTIHVNRSALLIDHVLHAVPVMVVHYCCELKRQLATLPLLRFSDVCVKFVSVARRAPSAASSSASEASGGSNAARTAAATAAATSTHHDVTIAKDWPPSEESFESSPPAVAGHFLLTRWLLQAVESYIEKACFLDETLVVRQLRSRRTLRRLLGWTLRLFSHTVFDPFLLSIVIPMLLSPPVPIAGDSGETAAVPQVLFTVPGVARGLAISAVGVAIQWLVMPTASRLVNRAVLTVFEAVEYLIMRRYAHWSDDEGEEGEDDEDDFDDGESDGVSLASGVSGATASAAAGTGRGGDRSPSQQSISSAAAAQLSTEDRIRREQRHLRRAKRERRRRREQRQAARDQAMRRTILRAIVYRVVSSVVAQSLVDHPLSVLVELLRGRATLHLTGMLTPYATMTYAQDGLRWANVWRYIAALTAPGQGGIGHAEEEEEEDVGVPPVVVALRRLGRDAAREAVVLSASVLDNSGQREALAEVEQRAATKKAEGGVTTAADSAEFLMHSLLSLSPFYYGLQFTVMDKLLSFYMAVWTRLTKQ